MFVSSYVEREVFQGMSSRHDAFHEVTTQQPVDSGFLHLSSCHVNDVNNGTCYLLYLVKPEHDVGQFRGV